MCSKDLTPQQVRPIEAEIDRQVRYLIRLQDRMEQRGFPADDPLLQRVNHARAALKELGAELMPLKTGWGGGSQH